MESLVSDTLAGARKTANLVFTEWGRFASGELGGADWKWNKADLYLLYIQYLYVGGRGMKSCRMCTRNSPVHERDLLQELQDCLLLLGRGETRPGASLFKNKIFITRAYIQNKEMRERVDSMSRLFLTVHKHNLAELGADTLTFCEFDSFLYPFPGFSELGKVCTCIYH